MLRTIALQYPMGHRSTLYSNPAFAHPAALLIIILGLACFSAGIVAIYIVKFRKPDVQHDSLFDALWVSMKFAAIATLALFLGTGAGQFFFFDMHPFTNGTAIALYHALPFFIEVLVAILVTNRLLKAGFLAKRWQKLVAPAIAFMAFTAVNATYLSLLDGSWSQIGMLALRIMDEMSASVSLPIELASRTVFVDPLFSLNWLLEQVKASRGDQYLLAKLLPAIFFVVVVASGSRSLFDLVFRGAE